MLTGTTSGSPVFCDRDERVCIPRPLADEPLVALFMYDTRPRAEHGRGWVVAVRDAQAMWQTLGIYPSGYREPCDGSMCDRLGRLVFGPAPRDLDRSTWRSTATMSLSTPIS